MIKRISLALFTIWYASVSLVIFGMKINHHAVESHNDQWITHAVAMTDSSCDTDSNSCISCGDGWWVWCCDNESTCFVKCSKWVWLYAYTNPKDDDKQIIDDSDISLFSYTTLNWTFSEYKIIWNRKKDITYQISQTPHYRVGIIQLVL